ncbi:MAG: hypothetical protein JWP00_4860 [Chloroflexi bacterium]|jgi:hypothetical protein|nr:hypothetical protein [Chloroflexota bacterium]
MSDTTPTGKETKTVQEQLAAQTPKVEEQIEKQIQTGKLREPQDLPLASNNDKPLISFDFDGVICRPPFGQNRVLGRMLHEEDLPENIRMVDGPATTLQRRIYLQARGLVEDLKYFGRDPMEAAREGIIAVSQYRTPIIITGRSYMAKSIIDAWLKKYKMEEYFSAIYANNTALPTRQFKLYMLRRLNIDEHVDDDGAITYYLAKKGIKQLFLRDWPRNQGLPYPANVAHFTNISEIARHLSRSKVTS